MSHRIPRRTGTRRSLLRIAPLIMLLLAACADQNSTTAVVPESYNLKVSGSVRDWNLGEGFYVFVGEPAVRGPAEAAFPDRFVAAPIGPDGRFSLELAGPPAQLDEGGLCAGTRSRSFHYLAVTGRPEPGKEFSELAVIRPVVEGDELLFLTWMERGGTSDCATDREDGLAAGWHVLSFTQTDAGRELNGELAPAEIEWVLRH